MPNGMTKTGAHKLRLTRSEKVAREKDAKSMAGRFNEIQSIDIQVADGLQKLFDDTVAKAEQEKSLIIADAKADATKIAKELHESYINQLKLKGKSIIENAIKDAKRISDEVNVWGKNLIENMRRLAYAEKQVEQLSQELITIKAERDLFAEQYAILKKANSQGHQYK